MAHLGTHGTPHGNFKPLERHMGQFVVANGAFGMHMEHFGRLTDWRGVTRDTLVTRGAFSERKLHFGGFF